MTPRSDLWWEKSSPLRFPTARGKLDQVYDSLPRLSRLVDENEDEVDDALPTYPLPRSPDKVAQVIAMTHSRTEASTDRGHS